MGLDIRLLGPIEVDLEPGDDVIACFIPTPVDDRAHFEHGMEASFTVG